MRRTYSFLSWGNVHLIWCIILVYIFPVKTYQPYIYDVNDIMRYKKMYVGSAQCSCTVFAVAMAEVHSKLAQIRAICSKRRVFYLPLICCGF